MSGKENTRKQFVEEMGIVMERAGFPRMAGRILGSLMISAKGETSSDELSEELTASRGAVSTATRQLIAAGLVDRVGKPADRRDYFRIRPGAWGQLMKLRLQSVIDFHMVIEYGLAAIGTQNTKPKERLNEVHELYEFFEREFREMVARWDAKQANKSGKK